MDPFSQAALGAVVGQAAGHRSLGYRAAAYGALEDRLGTPGLQGGERLRLDAATIAEVENPALRRSLQGQERKPDRADCAKGGA